VIRHGQMMVARGIGFQYDVAAFLIDAVVTVMFAEQLDEFRTGKVAAISCAREQFIPHQMQTHDGGFGLVEEISGNRLAHIGAQLFPGVALRKDVVRKTFGHITAVAFLRHAKDNFRVHDQTMPESRRAVKFTQTNPSAARVPALSIFPGPVVCASGGRCLRA